MPVGQIALSLVESLLDMVSNLFLVFLFTVYLLLPGSKAGNDNNPGMDEPTEVDDQILRYIKGKVSLSLLVGSVTAFVLLFCGLDLWLVFGLLAFWLNFIPNVGAVVATFLPMPLVVLDPDISPVGMILAFVLPFCCHMVVGNVLEPLVFGHSLELQPVIILLSLMVWGMLWGITGMVLAVPITAVLKIHLASINHPVAIYLVHVLDGGMLSGGADLPLEPSEDTTPLRGSSCHREPAAMEAATLPLVSVAPASS